MEVRKVKESEARYEFAASYAQQRLWLLDRLEPGNVIYNIPLAYQLKGRLDLAALQASFAHLVARHESLRTSFMEANGQLRQVIRGRGEVAIEVEEVDGASLAERRQRAEQISR